MAKEQELLEKISEYAKENSPNKMEKICKYAKENSLDILGVIEGCAKENSLTKTEREKWAEYAKDLFNKYYTQERILEAAADIANCHDMRMEYARGGLLCERGFYCRSIMLDLYISNRRRGKILKKISSKIPDYAFYFNNDILTMAAKYYKQNNEVIEHIRWSDNVESSILLTPKMQIAEWPQVCEAIVNEQGMLEKNTIVTFFMDNNRSISHFNMYLENYQYKENKLYESKLIAISGNSHEFMHLDTVNFIYTYDDSGIVDEYFMECSWANEDEAEKSALPEHIKQMINKTILNY